MKNPWTIVLVVAVVLIGGSFMYAGSVNSKNNEGVEFTPHLKGNPDASVVLLEYSDLQCPACAAFQPALEEVFAKYGDVLRFEYKHFPLPVHNLAEPAARAAEAAGQQDSFFPYHDLLFANQATWSRSPNPNALFIKYAEELGLDVELFKRHLNSSLIRDKVRADGLAAREAGLTGTPTFFLNGERMTIETFEDFQNQIALAVDPNATTSAPAVSSEPKVEFGI